MPQDENTLDRRRFLKHTAAGLGVVATVGSIAGAGAKTGGEDAPAADVKDVIWRSKAPTMAYRRLGRTNYMVSRIVNGWAGNESMWRRMLTQGMNYLRHRPWVRQFRSGAQAVPQALPRQVLGHQQVDRRRGL